MRRSLVPVTAVVFAAVGIAPPLRAQSPAAVSLLQPIERFVGTTRLRGKEVRVAIQNWSMINRQKIDALKLPLRGLTVVQLRGGRIITIIDGKRQKRRAGEFWTVPPSSKMGLETEDDSATIQTIVVAE
jgi:hypothetical protein